MTAGMTRDDQMFSVRIAPWHQGTGTNVLILDDHPEPAQVLEHAGLNWNVDEFELVRNNFPNPSVTGWKELARSDNGATLTVVHDSYTVLQNQVGAEVMDLLLGEGQNVQYETGGSTYGGRTCYLTAKINEEFFVKGDNSPTFPHLVVTWAHDGGSALQARATNVRVVCANTISASEAESRRTGRNFTFRHTGNVHARIEDARDALRGVREEASVFQVLANELADITVSEAQREDFVTRFIPAPATDLVISDRVLDNINEARGKVRGLFDGETIPEAHTNTAYGLLLAGTEYLDHLRGYRNSDTYLGRTLLREDGLKARLVPMIREVANA